MSVGYMVSLVFFSSLRVTKAKPSSPISTVSMLRCVPLRRRLPVPASLTDSTFHIFLDLDHTLVGRQPASCRVPPGLEHLRSCTYRRPQLTTGDPTSTAKEYRITERPDLADFLPALHALPELAAHHASVHSRRLPVKAQSPAGDDVTRAPPVEIHLFTANTLEYAEAVLPIIDPSKTLIRKIWHGAHTVKMERGAAAPAVVADEENDGGCWGDSPASLARRNGDDCIVHAKQLSALGIPGLLEYQDIVCNTNDDRCNTPFLLNAFLIDDRTESFEYTEYLNGILVPPFHAGHRRRRKNERDDVMTTCPAEGPAVDGALMGDVLGLLSEVYGEYSDLVRSIPATPERPSLWPSPATCRAVMVDAVVDYKAKVTALISEHNQRVQCGQ